MKSFLNLTLILILFFSCTSPREALKKGQYRTALNLASNEIKNGKNIEQNELILKKAADQLVKKTMYENKDKLNSDNIKNWIKVQDKFYGVLNSLGKANIESGEKITDTYDKLCSAKIDVDFKIAEYYYNSGLDLLKEYNQTKLKETARQAYFQFSESKNQGGPGFFNDIDDLLEYSLQNGIVYYECDDLDLGNSLFFREIQPGADFEPDCIVEVNQSSIDFDEEEDKIEDQYTKDIEVGTKETRDTAGNVIYKPIYETIEATVYTIKHTITAYNTTTIDVDDMTGQCTIESESFTTEFSDSYKEIKIEGDERAINEDIDEKSGEPAFFRDDLEDKLNEKIQEKLNSL